MHKHQAEIQLQYIFLSIYNRITWFLLPKAFLGWLLAHATWHEETTHRVLLERNMSCVTIASGWPSTIIFVWSTITAHITSALLYLQCAELLASEYLFSPYQEKPNLNMLPQYLFPPLLLALTELARSQN